MASSTQRTFPKTILGFVLLSALPLAGCTGWAGMNGTDSTPAQEVAALPCSEHKAHVLMQRLNNVEYNNTVQDLLFLDATTRPGDAFPADVREFSGFENESGLMGISSQLMDEYFSAAVRVSREAMAKSASKIAPCTGTATRTCAMAAPRTLAGRAFRRPASEEEVNGILKVYDSQASEGYAAGMTVAIQALLVSPNFLFRPADDALDDFQLATRLSYFLWQSMPDDELMEHALQSDLGNSAVLEAQVKRMMRHPRAASLTQSFARQWLALSEVLTKGVDTTLYPNFTAELKRDLELESLHFIDSIITEDKDPREVFTGKYSFLNQRLATHYGVPGITGENFRKVDFSPALPRSGIFTHGSMMVGSAGSGIRTSPVTRGFWVLSKVLCEPPAPPPPGIPPLNEESLETKTLPEVLAEHRQNPVCASCHNLMDPIGLGLEPFDNVGQIRSAYPTGEHIATAGTLPGGAAFGDTVQAVNLLMNDARTETCVVEKLMSYAVGRRMKKSIDGCGMESVATTTFQGSASFSELLANIAKSRIFRANDGELTP
jgi:hypothetical protein